MFYTIYKITNQVDGKIYIGSHKTGKLDDGYMGSGKYLKRAIAKYGIDKFTKEILFVFDTPELMYAKEAELVNEDFLATENTYNLKVGGFGGFDYINATCDLQARNRTINSKKDYSFMAEVAKAGRDSIKMLLVEHGGAWWYSPRFTGMRHTNEAKVKIGQANSVHQSGSKNSQFDTRWIHSMKLKQSKKIKKEEPLPEGWLEGRKLKF